MLQSFFEITLTFSVSCTSVKNILSIDCESVIKMRFMVGYKYPCFQYVVNKDRDNCLGKKYTFFLKKKIQKIK